MGLEVSADVLREISSNHFAMESDEDRTPCILLAAPNFEERSLGAINSIMRLSESKRQRFRVLITTLQAAWQKEILDTIKEENVAFALKTLKEGGIEFHQRRIFYPKIDYKAAFDALRDFARGEQFDLYIDISSFPRMMIANLLDHVMNRRHNEFAGDLDTRNIRFFYSEPISYPSSLHIETLGDLYGMFERCAFHGEVHKYQLIDNLIFLNGNSHDVAQTRAIALSDVRSAYVQNHYFIFFNKEKTGFSYEKLWQNIGALKGLRDAGERVRVVFDVEDMTMQLMETVDSIIDRQRGIEQSAVFFGGYGPKILWLSCYLAKRYYQNKARFVSDNDSPEVDGARAGPRKEVVADILTPRGSQYTSVYSHGISSTKLFELHKDVRTLEASIR